MEVKPSHFFPLGYKKTEVGVIPEQWETAAVADLVEPSAPICYGVVQVGQHSETGVPIVAIKFVKEIAHAPLHRTAINLEQPYARSRPRGGDILISIKGTIGRVGIVPNDFEGNISRELARIRIRADSCPEYIAHQLESGATQERIMRSVVGTTRLEFSIAALRKFPLPMPPTKTEQRAIATSLSDVDGLLSGLDRLIAKKRDLKQAAMQQLLTGQTRLPDFDGEWEGAKVQEVIAGFFCGPSPTCEERNIHDGEWGVLKTTAATKEKGWDWTKHKTLPRVFWNKPNLELKKGDVIVTKAGPRHRVGIAVWVDYVPPRIIVSGKMIGLRPRPDKIVPLMLAAAISARGAQGYLDQRTTGMAESQVNFENTALLEAPIRIPRIEEQNAIAEVLTEMDAELVALERRREKTRALKQAMMQELLTGRTRLLSADVVTKTQVQR